MRKKEPLGDTKPKDNTKSEKLIAFTFYTNVKVAKQLEEIYHKMRIEHSLDKGMKRITRSAIISMAIEKTFEDITKAPKGVERRKSNLLFFDIKQD